MVKNPKKPQVVLFGDILSEQMMPRLFAAADCYVLFTRGEGFGLPYAEAAACRMPVIATRYSGQTDFLDDENSYLVDIDGFSKADKTLAAVSYFYEDAEFPTLGPEVVARARAAMRRAFEDKEERTRKANLVYDRIVKEYGWNVCIKKMHEKLKEVHVGMFGER
jgi:glycosyltransferase involved in cell wall biosynthesis